MFAQIVSGFGLMTNVDWSTIFKTFYEVVRVKVTCKDWRKIPKERLYELGLKLYVVEITIENEAKDKKATDGKGNDDDDGGGDNGDMENYDEDDDLDDLDDDATKSGKTAEQPKEQNPKISKQKNTGHKIVTLDLTQEDVMNQVYLMETLMAGKSEWLTAQGQGGAGNSSCINVTQVDIRNVSQEKGTASLKESAPSYTLATNVCKLTNMIQARLKTLLRVVLEIVARRHQKLVRSKILIAISWEIIYTA